MRFPSALVPLALASSILACSAESSPSVAPIAAGPYSGQVAVSDTQRQGGTFFFAKTDVAGSGAVTGTADTTAPTTVRETGTVRGTVTLAADSSTAVDVDLTFTFPTLGTYRARGRGIHSATTKEIGFSGLRTEDGKGVLLGETTGVLKSQ